MFFISSHSDPRRLRQQAFGTAILLLFLTSAFADQPSATATAGEHYVFMENMAVVIVCWFALILGAINGYAVTSKNDKAIVS